MPPWEIRRAVAIANNLHPDLAVLTGDLISDGNDPLEECIAELSQLQARLGIWGCNGNHEIYAEAEEKSQELFRRYGMRLLRQECAELEWRGSRFNLLGVDYQRQRTPSGEAFQMLRSIEPLVRKDIPNILLSHNPNSFPRAAELGIELSLAGHTHGGQIRVEIVDRQWSPARFITDFVAGLYRRPSGSKSAFLYVNRGLGTLGIPVRLGAPPEITLLTLRTAG
jgi:predicted MPP superfamily phosphohydrolase